MNQNTDSLFNTEIQKHTRYLAEKATLFEAGQVSELDMRAVLRDFCTNVSNVCGWDAAPAAAAQHIASQHDSTRAPAFAYIGHGRCVTQLPFGTLCFLGQNLDVSPAFWRDGVIEPWTTRLIRELLKPGDCYINLGANFGYYTVLGATLVGDAGSVLAVEANPRIFDCTVRSVFYSGITNRVRLHNIAVSDISGETMSFTLNPNFSGGGGLEWLHPKGVPFTSKQLVTDWESGNFSHASYRGELGGLSFDQSPLVLYEVTTCTIDELWQSAGAPAVHVLHMDIEGVEFMALSGATAMLAANPDLHIVTEISPIFEWDARKMDAFAKTMQALQQSGHRAYRVLPQADSTHLKPIDLAASIHSLEHGDYILMNAHSRLSSFVD